MAQIIKNTFIFGSRSCFCSPVWIMEALMFQEFSVTS